MGCGRCVCVNVSVCLMMGLLCEVVSGLMWKFGCVVCYVVICVLVVFDVLLVSIVDRLLMCGSEVVLLCLGSCFVWWKFVGRLSVMFELLVMSGRFVYVLLSM